MNCSGGGIGTSSVVPCEDAGAPTVARTKSFASLTNDSSSCSLLVAVALWASSLELIRSLKHEALRAKGFSKAFDNTNDEKQNCSCQ